MPDTESSSNGGEYPFSEDLHPSTPTGERAVLEARTAYDIKGAHARLQGIEDDVLKEIPIMPPGSRLEQGSTYVDLRQDEPREFTANGTEEAGGSNWYVPKRNVPYWVWNRLIGVSNPERLDQPGER